MMSEMQAAVATIVAVFNSYSEKEGDKYKLNNSEVMTLIKEQLPEYLAEGDKKKDVEDIMAELDANKDGEVDFMEFMILVVRLTCCVNHFFAEMDKCRENKCKGGQ